MRAHQFVTVINEVTISILALNQRLLGELALTDINSHHELGATAGEIQLVRGDFHGNDGAALLLVPPLASLIEATRSTREVVKQFLHILWWTDLRERHGEKLFP